MSIRKLAAFAAVTAFAAAPAAALADLHVNAPGFHRVVISGAAGTHGCHVHRDDLGAAVTCPDNARGTMTLYTDSEGGTPVCEVDFWPQTTTGKPWRAILSHQDSTNGSCSMTWQTGRTLLISLQQ